MIAMKNLKKLRQVAGFFVFIGFVALFSRFDTFGALAEVLTFFQLGPALVSLHLLAGFAGVAAVALLTLIAGRVYCSVFCPFGLLQDVFARIGRLFSRCQFKALPALMFLHYGLAFIVFGAVIAGFMLPLSLIEPFSLSGRVFTAVFQPVLSFVFRSDAFAGAGGINWFRQASIKPFSLPGTLMAVAAVLLFMVVCNKWGRVYCNSVCPVGAFLRLLARFSIFRLKINPTLCIGCGMCAKHCKAGCIDVADKHIDFSRCVACYNCVSVCNVSAINLQKSSVCEPQKVEFSAGRRAMGACMVGAAVGYLAPVVIFAKPKNTEVILPPGALNYQRFSSKCISCHLCVSACPSSIIRPMAISPMLVSLQQPVLDFSAGMCEQNCNLCSQICPVEAIVPVSKEDKRLLKIGEVVYRKHLCVVETNGRDCGACAEHCPTQAVKMVPYHSNLMIPEITPEICIGCGSCEHICPVRPEKAIIVRSVNEQTFVKMPEQKKLLNSGEQEEFPF